MQRQQKHVQGKTGVRSAIASLTKFFRIIIKTAGKILNTKNNIKNNYANTYNRGGLMNRNNFVDFMPKERLLALSDGVFAIVMTLLVLEIKLPEHIGRINQPQLMKSLLEIAPKLEIYVITFITIGVFWIVHHFDFHYIKHIDRQFIWTNILLLLFITLIPFSSDLIGEFPNCHIASIIYGLNMLFIWLIIFYSWRYATKNHRLVDENLNSRFIDYVSRRNLFIAFAFLISTVISIVSAHIGITSYILIPVIVKIYGRRFQEFPQITDENVSQHVNA
jgi:uncharacterized membrane protein